MIMLMNKELILKTARQNISKWKELLGFSGWKIFPEIAIFKRSDGYPQQGDFRLDYARKKITILIGEELTLSVEEIIVHELVHIMLWPLDQKCVSTIHKLPRAKQKRSESDFLGKLEVVVDQITKGYLRSVDSGLNSKTNK